jgi:hypothetical protein
MRILSTLGVGWWGTPPFYLTGQTAGAGTTNGVFVGIRGLDGISSGLAETIGNLIRLKLLAGSSSGLGTVSHPALTRVAVLLGMTKGTGVTIGDLLLALNLYAVTVGQASVSGIMHRIATDIGSASLSPEGTWTATITEEGNVASIS